MTTRRAILHIAKQVGQDIDGSAVSQETLAAGPMLAQAGATPDLIACLVAEAGKKRPTGQIIEGCSFLLQAALTDLRITASGGDAPSRVMLAEACHAVEAAVAGKRLDQKLLIMIARAVAQAGIDPGPALKAATLVAMEDHAAVESAQPQRGSLLDHLAPLAEALGHDPFAVYAELSASGAAIPPEHRAAMAAALAASTLPALRDAALGFLFDADPAPGAAVLEVLAGQARQHPVPSRMVERLISIRPWLPPARQPKLDATIRTLRLNAAAPLPAAHGEVISLLASLCDGAGAQSLFALIKNGRSYNLASTLIKSDAGVADALVHDQMPKREADGIVARITGAMEAVKVPITFARKRLADALATNLARGVPPPFTLLQVAEMLGLGLLQPAATSPMALAEELLAGLAPEKTGPEATRAAHSAAADWPDQFDAVRSWYEAGEAVDALLHPIRSRRKRVEAVLAHQLPGRRQFWAERCAWMAATLREDTSDNKWISFALVARDLASGLPLATNPLFDVIAEATANAFAGRNARAKMF